MFYQDTLEKQSNEVNITDLEPDVVQRLIQFMSGKVCLHGDRWIKIFALHLQLMDKSIFNGFIKDSLILIDSVSDPFHEKGTDPGSQYLTKIMENFHTN